MALDLLPFDRELCPQSTISRLENLLDVSALLKMGSATADLYCESLARVPKRITIDIVDTFDRDSQPGAGSKRKHLNVSNFYCIVLPS